MNADKVLKGMLLTEKANKQSAELGQYTFEVVKGANKHAIAEAVEATFKVTVRRVNTQNYRGKNKRSRQGQPSTTSDYKKAIVTLKPATRSSSSEKAPATRNSRHAHQTFPPAHALPALHLAQQARGPLKGAPRARPHRAQAQVGRPQRVRPRDLAPHRRRPQAALPDHRLQARHPRHPREGRGDRVRSQPHRPPRPPFLHERREALHPGPRGPQGGGHDRLLERGDDQRLHGRQLLPALHHPALDQAPLRGDGPGPRAQSWAARPAPASSSSASRTATPS